MNRRSVTVIACLAVQLCVGILYLWSIFNEPVRVFFGISPQMASMVQSVMMFGFVTGNLVGGFLQDKTNPRLVALIGVCLFGGGILLTSFIAAAPWLIFVTYGVIAGLGCGFAYGSVLSCLQKWFPNRRGFASGLSVAAFGMSTVVFTPVAETLMTRFDGNMQKTFLTLSIIFLAVGIVACIFIGLPKGQQAALSDAPFLTPKQALTKGRFWMIALTLFFVNATWNMVCPVIKTLAVDRGLSSSAAGLLVMLTGVFSAAGRLSMATVSDKVGRALTVSLLAFLTLTGAALLIFSSSWAFFAVILLIAFAYGGPSATLPAMTTDLCGARFGGTNYGLAMMWLGISSVVFNALAGFLFGTTGSYTVGFVIAAVTALITLGLMGVYTLLDRRSKAVSSAQRSF